MPTYFYFYAALLLIGSWVVVHASLWVPTYIREEEKLFLDSIRQQMADGIEIDFDSFPSEETSPVSLFLRQLVQFPQVNKLSIIVASLSVFLGVWALSQEDSVTKAILWLLFFWGLLILAAVDLQTKLLPDMFTMPLLWAGLVAQLTPATQSIGLDQALWGAVAGYLPLRLLSVVYSLIRKIEGIGQGDLKLLAIMGAWSGASIILGVVFLASIFIVMHFMVERLFLKSHLGMRQQIAFGPYLIGAYLLLLLLYVDPKKFINLGL